MFNKALVWINKCFRILNIFHCTVITLTDTKLLYTEPKIFEVYLNLVVAFHESYFEDLFDL